MNKLNNKGFTLIEILAVVAMITIISLIAVPSILSIINTGKDNSYEILMKNINTASKNLYEEVEYMGELENIKIIKLDEFNEYIEIELQILVKNGFLEVANDSKTILNPKTNEFIGNCQIKIIKVTKDDKITYKLESLSTNDICPSTNDYTI